MMSSQFDYKNYLKIITGLNPDDNGYSRVFIELDSRLKKSGDVVEVAVRDLAKLLTETKNIGTIKSDRLIGKDVQIDLVQSMMPDFKKRYHSVRSSTRQSLERLRKMYNNRFARFIGYYEDWDFLPKGRFSKALKDELRRFYFQAFKLGVKGSGLTAYDISERIVLSSEEERFVESAIIDEMQYFNKLLKGYFDDTMISTFEKRIDRFLKTASTMYAAGLVTSVHPNSIFHWILNRDRSSTCFVGDTRLSLLDGTEKSFKELCELYPDGEEFYVYSCDKNNNIAVGVAHHPHKTGTQVPVYKVTLDNGKSEICTPDHLWKLRDGSYRKAIDLKSGDSLMPLYRRISSKKDGDRLDGYEIHYNPGSDGEKYTHTMSHDWGFPPPHFEGMVRHHGDFNKRNNDPSNLSPMGYWEHKQYHVSLMIEMLDDPLLRLIFVETCKQNAIKRNENPTSAMLEQRKKFIESGRDFMNHTVEGKELNIRTSREYANKISNKVCPRCGKICSTNASYAGHLCHCQRDNKSRKLLMIMTRTLEKGRRLVVDGVTEEDWNNKRVRYSPTLATIIKYFGSFEKYRLKCLSVVNHKVISVEFHGYEDVYCMTVKEHENFALSSGVFVHNCPECLFMRDNSPYVKYTLPVTPKSGFSSCLDNCRCSIRVVRSDPERVQQIVDNQKKHLLLKRMRELRRTV